MSNAAPAPAGDFEYKPLSGWALAGFILSSLFALVVVVTTGIALARGTPLFFPAWALTPALAAFVLCYIGQAKIQASEGILAGAALARYGMWMSLLAGLGYGAYVGMVGLAVTQQAEAFLNNPRDGFFAALQKGTPADVNAAFLMTQLPTVRQGVRVDNEKLLGDRFDQPEGPGDPGKLSMFRRGWIVRSIRDGGPEGTKIESLGARDWRFENKSFIVVRTYRISTPETNYVLAVQAESQDLDDGRQWFVNWNKTTKVEAETTPWGEAMHQVRYHGFRHVGGWLQQKGGRDWTIDFDAMDGTDWSSILPDHPDARRAVKEKVKERFEKPFPGAFELPRDVQGELTPYEKLPSGQVRVDLPVEMKFVGVGGISNYQVRTAILAETKEKVDPGALPHEFNLVPKKIRVVHAVPIAEVRKK